VLQWYVSGTIDIGGAARGRGLEGLYSMKTRSESVLALLLLCASEVSGALRVCESGIAGKILKIWAS
jgi:hypothetical protein